MADDFTDNERTRPTAPPDKEAALEAQLGGLLKQLEAQQSSSSLDTRQEQAPVDAGGLSFEGMMVGIVVSAVGLGYLRWGKNTGQPLLALAGVLLLVVPWVVSDALWLSLAGVGIAVLGALAQRFFFPSSY